MRRSGQEPRRLGPPDTSTTVRSEGTTVQRCGDTDVSEKWINMHYAMVKERKEALAEDLAPLVEKLRGTLCEDN